MRLQDLATTTLSGLAVDLLRDHGALLKATPATGWHVPDVEASSLALSQALTANPLEGRIERLSTVLAPLDDRHDHRFRAVRGLCAVMRELALGADPPDEAAAQTWATIEEKVAPDGAFQVNKSYWVEGSEAVTRVDAVLATYRPVLAATPVANGTALDVFLGYQSAGRSMGTTLTELGATEAMMAELPRIRSLRLALSKDLDTLFDLLSKSKLPEATKAQLRGPFEKAIESASTLAAERKKTASKSAASAPAAPGEPSGDASME